MAGMIDQIGRMQRTVSTVGVGPDETRTVRLQRTFDAQIEDVWDACTSATRIGRWFLPITGELRVGGRYQLQGNAGGTVLRCEPPRLFRVTWEMGAGPRTEVEVRLSPGSDGQTLFELDHIHIGQVDPAFWEQFGPGAVGVGWDLALLGLALHLAGGRIDDPEAWQTSPEAIELMAWSSEAWGRANVAFGATPEQARSAVANTTSFYTGQPAPEASGSTDGASS